MWYSGSIESAISSAKEKKALLLVFVREGGPESEKMESVLNDADIRKLCQDNDVTALRLESESELGKQFAKIYPVVRVPILFLIGTGGKPLEIVVAIEDKEAFVNQLSSAVEIHCRDVDEKLKQAQASGVTPKRKDTPRPDRILPPAPPLTQADAPVTSSSALAQEMEEAPEEADLEDRLNRARDLLDVRRIQKAKAEAEEEKARELKRRQEGQAMLKTQQERSEKEMKELANERKRQKESDREALRRIKEQIAQDRADKNERYKKDAEELKAKREEELRQKEQERMDQMREAEAKRSSVARIQFRLPDGSSMSCEFLADATLKEAVVFVKDECEREGIRIGSFLLIQMYPRREFRDQDMDRTFRDLQLAPSSTLLVMPENKGRVGWGGGRDGIFGQVLSLFLWPIQFVYQMFLSFFGWNHPRGRIEGSSAQKKDKEGNAGFGRNEGGVRRMDTSAEDGNDKDDDNATWNGNSTQQL